MCDKGTGHMLSNGTSLIISEACLYAIRCVHVVRVNNAQLQLLNAFDIASFFIDAGDVVPNHFKSCKVTR